MIAIRSRGFLLPSQTSLLDFNPTEDLFQSMLRTLPSESKFVGSKTFFFHTSPQQYLFEVFVQVDRAIAVNQHARQRFSNNNNSKNSDSVITTNNQGKGLGEKYFDLVVPAGMPCQIHLRLPRKYKRKLLICWNSSHVFSL